MNGFNLTFKSGGSFFAGESRKTDLADSACPGDDCSIQQENEDDPLAGTIWDNRLVALRSAS